MTTQRQSVLEAVRSSCVFATEQHSNHIVIDQDAVAALAAELPAEDVRASLRGIMFPIKFDTLEQEVTLLALYHMLDGGSGYDQLLLKRNRRDSRETLQFGIIGLHMGGGKLDSKWMKEFSLQSVHNFFGIDAMDEHEVMPGVTMSKPGVLHPFAKSIVLALNETGAILGDMEVNSLGEYIIQGLTQRKARNKPLLAADLVEELAETFPSAFADVGLYEGRTLTFHRRAQELVGALAARFGQEDGRFAFGDVDALTADSGSTVPAVLRLKGVLKLQGELASTVDAGEELPPGPHERALRAAAVVACDAVVKAAGGGQFNAAQLGAYLGFLTEEGRALHGQIKRHVTRGTLAY